MYLFVKLQSVEGEHHEKAVELLKQAKGNTLLSNTCIGVLWFYAGQRVNSVPVDQKVTHSVCQSICLSIY